MKYGNRSSSKRFLASPILAVILVIVLVFSSKAAWNMHSSARMSDEKLSRAQSDLLALQKRRNELATSVLYLSTDEGMEAQLRSKFKAVKPGESVVVILNDSSQASTSQTASITNTSWWRRLLNSIGL